MYKKLLSDYDQIARSDKIVKEIRDNIFRILSEIPVDNQKLVIIERLCMSISIIALRSCNTFWSESVNEIIQYGS